jgi:hypothetical protein
MTDLEAIRRRIDLKIQAVRLILDEIEALEKAEREVEIEQNRRFTDDILEVINP